MTNENRLIYANEAYEIARASGRHSDFARSRADLTSLEEVLEECTTVDAVEVVRCKNCDHWKDSVSGCTDHVKFCEIGFYMVGENGYCVYVERKTDG